MAFHSYVITVPTHVGLKAMGYSEGRAPLLHHLRLSPRARLGAATKQVPRELCMGALVTWDREAV